MILNDVSSTYTLGIIHTAWSGNPVLSRLTLLRMGENMCHGQASRIYLGDSHTTRNFCNRLFQNIPDNAKPAAIYHSLTMAHMGRYRILRGIPVGQFVSGIHFLSRERTTFWWDTCRRGTKPKYRRFRSDAQRIITQLLNWRSLFLELALCSNMSNDGFWLRHSVQYGLVDIPELLVMLGLLVTLYHHSCLLFAKVPQCHKASGGEGLAQHSSRVRWCTIPWINLWRRRNFELADSHQDPMKLPWATPIANNMDNIPFESHKYPIRITLRSENMAP